MAEHLIVYGHGQGDPGAGGNGYQEATFTRNILGPHLEKYAKQLKKNTVKFYDKSLNMYTQSQAGKGAYSVSTKTASVTELHLDAASSSATGGHVIISSSFNPDKYDVAIAAVIGKYVGWWGSVKNSKGVNKRSDLLNLNVFARRGISYRLVELGFITNKNDVDKLVKNIDAVAKDLIEAITGETIAVKKAVVYQTKKGWYEALKDDVFYQEKELKNKSGWNIKKGQRIVADEVVRVGKYTRGKVRLGSVYRYFTLRDDFFKKV